MKKSVFYGTIAASALLAGGASAQSMLETIQDRGELACGVSTGLAGFSAPDANGVWQGFDVAVCRAVAAAVLNDPMAVNFVFDHRADPLLCARFGRGRHAGAQHHLDLLA